MNTVQRIAKNTIVLIASNIASGVVGLFFVMYVAQYLGANGFGILSFALAFTAIFSVFTDLGLSTLTIREVAREKSLAHKYFGNTATLKLILSVLTLGILFVAINLMGYPEQTLKVVYIIALSVILDSFNLLFYAIFQAYERMEFVTLSQALAGAVRLGSILLIISLGYGIITVAYIYLIASAVSLLFSMGISTWKFPRFGFQFNLVFWEHLVKQAWPFALALIFGTILYWIDSVMLSMMKGNETVGFYNAAYRILVYLTFLPNVYFFSVFPSMSRFFITSPDALRLIYEKSVKYMGIIAIPIAVGGTILAKPMILLIFQKEYNQSILAFQILIWSLVFIFVSSIFAHLFNSINRQIIHAKVVGIIVLVNIILNLILIPGYSYIGASIATVATELVSLLLVYFWSRHIGYGIAFTKLAVLGLKIFIASAVMGISVYFLRDLIIWAVIPVGAILYFLVLIAVRGLDREDLGLLRQLMKRTPSPESE